MLMKLMLHSSKNSATALLLANPCSLCNPRHSTSVSLIQIDSSVGTLWYLHSLPERKLDCAIYNERGAYKQKITDCYDFTTCEIITTLEWLSAIALAL